MSKAWFYTGTEENRPHTMVGFKNVNDALERYPNSDPELWEVFEIDESQFVIKYPKGIGPQPERD